MDLSLNQQLLKPQCSSWLIISSKITAQNVALSWVAEAMSLLIILTQELVQSQPSY